MKRLWLIVSILVLSVVSLLIGASELSSQVILISRLPRLISLIIAGIGMSISGLIMQQLSQNKFVSPTTGATIDAAQLGVVMGMVLMPGASMAMKTGMAFVFALLGTGLFIGVMRRITLKSAILVPLVGIMFGNIIGALTTFIAYEYDVMQNVSTFMQGDFSMVLKGNYEMLYITVPLILMAFLFANHFNIVGMGQDFATNLGLSYTHILYLGLGIVALVTASIVITIGSVPFVGLIVPNIVSLYKGDKISGTLVDTALMGVLFLIICDLIGRMVIYPYEIPISLTVGVIGSIVFLILILRRENHATA